MRRLLVQCLVRPLLIKLGEEVVELSLLCSKVPRRWSGGFGLECSVHAFMATVLLRFARFDEFWQNTKAHPPG